MFVSFVTMNYYSSIREYHQNTCHTYVLLCVKNDDGGPKKGHFHQSSDKNKDVNESMQVQGRNKALESLI